MNVGIIGLGKMGLLHAGILSSLDGVRLVAITDKEDLIKNCVQKALPEVKIYSDYQKMLLKEELALVYITTPVSSHVPIANLCIDRGISFFVEKPLASNIEECKALCSRLKGNHLVHAVGYSKRFLDTFSKAKELLDSKLLGDLIYVKSSMYVSQLFNAGKGWRYKKQESGGGVLLELASHLVDLLLWYFGKIKYVSAIMKSHYSAEVEDFAHSGIVFESGLTGYLDTSWSVRNYRLPEITIEVHGEKGMMTVNDDFIRINVDNKFEGFQPSLTTIWKQDLVRGTIIDIAGPEYTHEDIHVVNCVNHKTQTLISSFEAAKTQSVIESMYVSGVERVSKEVQYII